MSKCVLRKRKAAAAGVDNNAPPSRRAKRCPSGNDLLLEEGLEEEALERSKTMEMELGPGHEVQLEEGPCAPRTPLTSRSKRKSIGSASIEQELVRERSLLASSFRGAGDMLQLQAMPTETLILIFEMLSDEDRVLVSHTCSRFLHIVQEHVGLRDTLVQTLSVRPLTNESAEKWERDDHTSRPLADPAWVEEKERQYEEENEEDNKDEEDDNDDGEEEDDDDELVIERYVEVSIPGHNRSFLAFFHPTRSSSSSREQLEALYGPGLPDQVYDPSHMVIGFFPSPRDPLKRGDLCARHDVTRYVLASFKTSSWEWCSLGWTLRVFVSRTELGRALERDMPMQTISYSSLVSWCMRTYEVAMRPLYWSRWSNSRLASPHPHAQPANVTIPLKEYQLRALAWMRNVERASVSTSIELYPWCPIPGSVQYGLSLDELSQKVCKREHVQPESLTVRGGVYADEMGLGKTATVIALIAASSSDRPAADAGDEGVCSGTFVLVPTQLVSQWAQEVKKFSPSLRVSQLKGIVDLKKMTPAKFKSSDIVIMSHSFLKNQRMGTDGLMHPLDVRYHRMVIDEAHELKEELYSLGQRVQTGLRWYVSGTPFATESLMISAFRFVLGPFPVTASLLTDGLMRPMFLAACKQHVYWRNTKASVGSQVDVPDVCETLELVNLSPIERDAYDALLLGGADLRMFCASPLSVRLFRHWVLQAQGRADPDSARYYRHRKTEKMKLKKLEAELVPLDPEGIRRLALAHYIDELKGSRMSLAAYPTSRKQEAVERAEAQVAIFRRPSSYEEREVVCEGADEAAVKRCGSKMAALVAYVKRTRERDPAAKMIVFTQFDWMAERLKAALMECAFPPHEVVACKGNFAVRNKAIKVFGLPHTDPKSACVMVLSMKSAASGTHLVCASHVLLLDPVGETVEEVRAQDAQAIARACRVGQTQVVNVVRIVVRDTIEQQEYENAYGVVTA